MHQNCCESKDWGQFLVLVWREKTATVNTELAAVSTATKTSIPISYLQPGRWFHYTRLPESRTPSLLRCAEDVTPFCMDSCSKKTCAKGRNWKDEKKSMGLPSCSVDYTLVIELQPAGVCLQGNGRRHNGNMAVGKGRAMLYHSPGSGLMFHWMKIPSFQIAKSWNSAANF